MRFLSLCTIATCIIATNAFVTTTPKQHRRTTYVNSNHYSDKQKVTASTTTVATRTSQTQLNAVLRHPMGRQQRRPVFNFLRRVIFRAGATETATSLMTATAQETFPTTTTGKIVELVVDNLDGIEGNKGSIYIQLYPEWAPRGVKRFEELTTEQFWDGNKVFRVIPGYISEFGIHGNPSTQAKWRSNTIPDDFCSDQSITNQYGTVSFAKSSTLGRTTQVFINTNRNGNQFLDDQGFLPIGRVIQGSMGVVERFYGGYSSTPNPRNIQLDGSSYLEREFPNLTYIQSSSFVE